MSALATEILAVRLGEILVPKGDDPIGRSIAEYGEWAGSEIDFLRQLISPGDSVVDIGANIGTHTIEFSEAVGASGKIIAVEPAKAIYDILLSNIDRTGSVNVSAVNAACGKRLDRAYIDFKYDDERGNYGATTVKKYGHEPVDVITVDSLALTSCRLIKIDVEGMGWDVIQGASQIIEKYRPILYIECNNAQEAHEIWCGLYKKQYTLLLIETSAYRQDNYAKNSHNTFGFARETAVLAMPDGERLPDKRVDGVYIRKLGSLDDLCVGVLSAPRYGDKSEFARKAFPLEVERLTQELARALYREKKLLAEVDHLRQAHVLPPETILSMLRRSRLWPIILPLRHFVRKLIERGA